MSGHSKSDFKIATRVRGADHIKLEQALFDHTYAEAIEVAQEYRQCTEVVYIAVYEYRSGYVDKLIYEFERD